MPLYAGLAETNITPPLGVWMCGYAFRPHGCVAVHDELWARALVLNDGKAAVAIVAMDLIGLDFDLVDQVRQMVGKSSGIPPHGILLNATHTHGGPNVRTFNTMGERDPAYIDVLTRKLAGIIKQAADRLEPASLAYGEAPVQLGINRRQYPHGDGVTTIGRNPAGPVDARVQALVVRNSRKEPKALLFSHACHPTTMGGENLQITADFPGVACEVVKGATDGAVMPLFLQACCGNINPEPRGTFESVQQHGETLGEAVLEALDSSSEVSAGRLEAVERTIDLPLIPPPALDVIQNNLDHWADKIRELKHADRPGHLLHAEGLHAYYSLEKEVAESDPMPLTKRFAIQRLTVGDTQMLGMPAEMFVQYQLDFERQAAGPVFALGYTNGVHGYVPVEADYPYGGYEVDGANRYYGTLMYTPACEMLIREEAYHLLGIREPDRSPYLVEG